MSSWIDLLGWSQQQITDLRFVGFSYLKQGKYDIAIAIFEALIAINDTNAYDWQTLGALYLEIGNNLKALNTIEKALKLDPNDSPTLLNRAKALFSLGYRRQALAQVKNLEISSDPQIASSASALLLAYS